MSGFLRILEQTLYDQDTLDRMKKEVIEKNWEGLMIRQDSFIKENVQRSLESKTIS